MKKTAILTLSLVLTYLMSNAQTQKGTQTLGLNLIYGHNSSTNSYFDSGTNYGSNVQDVTSISFSAMPTYSYLIANNSELGGGLTYSYQKNANTNSYTNITSPSSINNSSNSYGASIFFRKYILFTDKFGFRTGPFAGYQHVIYKSNSSPVANPNGNYTTNGYNIGASFDLVYYPSKKLGIAANIADLAYNYSKTTNASLFQNKNENFNFYFINGLSLSVFYIFGNK